MSFAIGVNRLTGMNSEAINKATHSAIEPTALQVRRPEIPARVVVVVISVFSSKIVIKTSGPEQCFDRPALIHRTVTFCHLVER